MEQIVFPGIAVLALVVSVFADRSKTRGAIRVAWKRFVTILPVFLTMIAGASLVLSLIPQEVYSRYLSSNHPAVGAIAAGALGSVSVMPGFVAFPLAAMLMTRGVARLTLSLFTTTLMMVGVVTLPIEMRYLGRRVALLRNAFALLVAIIVALATGAYFGELL
jgi:uncharacterized membrane protein YraQ (UPF0718 family)